MTGETCLRLMTTKIKADIVFITKTKKQKMVLLFGWYAVYLFSSRKSLFWVANKQTENLTITLESKIPLGVQQK